MVLIQALIHNYKWLLNLILVVSGYHVSSQGGTDVCTLRKSRSQLAES